jgi:hypothetical protein
MPALSALLGPLPIHEAEGYDPTITKQQDQLKL